MTNVTATATVEQEQQQQDFIDKEIAKAKAEYEAKQQQAEKVVERAKFDLAKIELEKKMIYDCFKCKTPRTCCKPGICADCMTLMSWNKYLQVYGSV